MLLLEADVATTGHRYNKMVQTQCLLSSLSGPDVQLDLLAFAAPSLLAQVPWCTLWWDLGLPDPTGPAAAITT